MTAHASVQDARHHIADTLTSELGELRVYPHRPAAVRTGDGWCLLRQVEPSTFGAVMAAFDVVIALSQDQTEAQERFDELAVRLVDVIGAKVGTPVSVTPQVIAVDGADMYVAVASLLIESE